MDYLDTNKNLVGILAYITPIGFIIAFIMNSKHYGERRLFGAFHLRQALGLFVLSFGLSLSLVIIRGVLPFLRTLLQFTDELSLLATIVLAVVGALNASKGLKKPLPLIGMPIEKYLGSTFS